MATELGASCLYNEASLPTEELGSSAIFHLTGYQWSTETQKSAVIKAATYAREQGIEVSFDVADPFMVGLYRDAYRNFIKNTATIVFANAEEAKALYGSVDEALDEISSTAIAVIKLGADGAKVKTKHESFSVPAHKVDVVDTTGAGDMFAGGFLYGHLQRNDLKSCAHMASRMASEVIQNLGASLNSDAIRDAKKSFQVL